VPAGVLPRVPHGWTILSGLFPRGRIRRENTGTDVPGADAAAVPSIRCDYGGICQIDETAGHFGDWMHRADTDGVWASWSANHTRPDSIECLYLKCPSARAQWPGALDAGSRERDSTECSGCGWPNRAGCNGLRVIIVNGLGDVKRGRKPRRRVRSSGVREMAVSRLDRDRGPTPPDAASRYGSPRAERPPDPHRLRS
jgi:catechol 2,3-dioxygenase-like lactoylglutathione lyase family enzyme